MASLVLPEILLILVVAFIVFVIFGPKNLPKLGKMFGSTMKEVRKGMNEFSDEMNMDDDKKKEENVTEERVISETIVEETPLVDPNRKVARVIYEDEIESEAKA